MGIFDIFKKKKVDIVQEEISLDDFIKIVKKEKEKNEEISKEFYKEIKGDLNNLEEELVSKVKVLKEIDVDEIKEREKIKSIVKESLSNYIVLIDRLIKNINQIEAKDDIISQINNEFNHFRKKSKVNYAKATYLIGKELGDLDNLIKKFFIELEKKLKEKNELIVKTESILNASSNLNKYLEYKKSLLELEKKEKEKEELISEKKEKIKEINKSINEKKESKEYKQNEKNKESKKELESLIDKDLLNLKKEIDFKKLTHINHHNKRDLEIINAYKDKFIDKSKNNSLDEIIKILKDSNMFSKNIESKINTFNENQKKLDEIEINTDIFKKENEEIKKLNDLIYELNSEKLTLEKQINSNKKEFNELHSKLSNIAENLNYKIKKI